MQIELLQKVQNKQIKIMDVLHKLCVINNISYYIIGGTALGAVRHMRFIPWDCDIDIAMPRNDYDRFIEHCDALIPKGYTCYHFKKESDYFPPHAVVALDNSQMVQKDDYLNPKLKRYGIFVDIFPLDIAPDSEKARAKQAKQLIKIRNAKTHKKAIVYSENSGLVRFIKKVVSLFYLPISMKYLNKRQDKCMRQYSNRDENECWCSMASHYSYKKQCMPKEIYGTPTLVEFSGRQYYAPEQLDAYLTRVFNDYMKLPNKEQQQRQMDYFIDAGW